MEIDAMFRQSLSTPKDGDTVPCRLETPLRPTIARIAYKLGT